MRGTHLEFEIEVWKENGLPHGRILRPDPEEIPLGMLLTRYARFLDIGRWPAAADKK